MDDLGLYISVGALLVIAAGQALPMFPWGDTIRFGKIRRFCKVLSVIGVLLLMLSMAVWAVGDVLTYKGLLQSEK